MATWRTIAAGETDANSPITQDLMDALRLNVEALAEGAAGAPRIVRGALSTGTNSVTVTVGTAGNPTYPEITLDAYSFFPGSGGDAGTDVSFMPATGTANADAPKWRVGGTPTGTEDSVTLVWRYILA